MIRLPNSILCFFIKKILDRFCILCAGWTGRKYREISRKLPKFPSTHNWWRILCRSRLIQKWKQNFQLSHTFLATKQNYNKPNHKKKWKLSLWFLVYSVSLWKKWKLYFFLNFPTLSRWPNTTTPPNITTKLTENTRGQWCLRSTLHFLFTGVEARITAPWSACGKMGMSFDAENKTGMGFHFFSNIKYYFFFPLSSYVLKIALELELFSSKIL